MASTASTLRIWSHSPSRRRRKSIKQGISISPEKVTIGLLLLIAWGWIMATIGMVFYHGYYQHRQNPQSQWTQDHYHHDAPEWMNLLQPRHNAEQKKPQKASLVTSMTGTTATAATAATATPLLIFTFARSEYLRETLTDILRYIPEDCSMGCPVIISQDGKAGDHEDVAAVIAEFTNKFRQTKPLVPVVHWRHAQPQSLPLQPQPQPQPPFQLRGSAAYQALAQHYKYALDQLFLLSSEYRAVQRVLILEEDLHIASDFFDYFKALAPLLDRDETLLAVSAYNDNGLKGKVLDPERVLRSDFFPGLGWMMTRRLWTTELSHKWPSAYWDDWLREPAQRQGRHILRPEVSRTYHFGVQGGASNNQYGQALHDVKLNTVAVDWTLSSSRQDQLAESLRLTVFNANYWQQIQAATLITNVADIATTAADQDLRLEYRDIEDFKRLARFLGLFPEEKAGVPRTAYKGVVEMRLIANHNGGGGGGRLLFLTPSPFETLQQEFAKETLR